MRVPAETQHWEEARRARSSPGRPRASCTRSAGLHWPAMAQTTAVRLTGEDLTPADVWRVAVEGARTGLADSARLKMAAAREVVERAVADEGPTYGVTTGFGRFVSTRIPSELAEE